MSCEFRSTAPVFSVRDVVQAIALYERLGFKGNPYDEGTGTPPYGFLCRGSIEIHLARVPDVDPKANTSAAYLYVTDTDALHAEWSAAGVPGRLTEPEDTPYDLREIAYIDPDGNLLRIGSPLDKA